MSLVESAVVSSISRNNDEEEGRLHHDDDDGLQQQQQQQQHKTETTETTALNNGTTGQQHQQKEYNDDDTQPLLSGASYDEIINYTAIKDEYNNKNYDNDDNNGNNYNSDYYSDASSGILDYDYDSNNEFDWREDDGLEKQQYATTAIAAGGGGGEGGDNQDNNTSTDNSSTTSKNINTNKNDNDNEKHHLDVWTMICIVSTAFTYGCIMTTLFIITLPVECLRIQNDHPSIEKSVALGIFVSIAGVTQLISPIIGKLSDTYEPPVNTETNTYHELGIRTPYHVLGSVITIIGLVLQVLGSYYGFWERYTVGFLFHMIGLNIMYAMMLAMIPDQIPSGQTGIANGILAFLLVCGSIFGFALFHSVFSESIISMYGLYICVVIVSAILTGTYAHDRDVQVFQNKRKQQKRRQKQQQKLKQQQEQEQNQKQQNSDLSSSSMRSNNDNNTNTDETDGSPNKKANSHRRHRRRRKKRFKIPNPVTETIIPVSHILYSMLIQPFMKFNFNTFIYESYTIDIVRYHDFFWVTISRLFYYCGMSVQTFFLYFLHDIIHIVNNTEDAVATLAIVAQCTGALTCYPVGYISDKMFHRQRKPFVYLACFFLGLTTLGVMFTTKFSQMILCSCALGAANGMYLTMETSLAVDTLPHSSEESAQLLGIWGVAAFLGSAIGPMINGPLLFILGGGQGQDQKQNGNNNDDDENNNNGNDEQGYTLQGYEAILSLSSFYFFCSAISLQMVHSSSNSSSSSSRSKQQQQHQQQRRRGENK